MTIVFRKLGTIPELEQVAELEHLVWGEPPLPVHQTLIAAKHGGILIGAWDGEVLAGFVYSFPGFVDGELYLWSHMMGVHPNYRNQGIGYQLKMQQAETAREMGYRTIRWTYDPLQSRNGYLNIAKLGAVCRIYIENCYGDMPDALNQGLPSDRFDVEWHMDRERVASVERPFDETRSALAFALREDGLPEVTAERMELLEGGNVLYLPVPVRFAEMKETEAALALQWRMSTRKVCQAAFATGWVVVDVVQGQRDAVQYYVLARGVEQS